MYQSLNGANYGSGGPIEEVKKRKLSKFNPPNDGQVKSSPAVEQIPKLYTIDALGEISPILTLLTILTIFTFDNVDTFYNVDNFDWDLKNVL